MREFPAFMRDPGNRIASSSEHTQGIEGYLFDGANEQQTALWTAHNDAISAPHAHDFDEWVYVLEGSVTLEIGGAQRVIEAGGECTIPRGTLQRMGVRAGTRTLHVFGGRRAERAEGVELPPLALALSFVDAINRNQLGRLTSLMSEDHRLCILDEPPVEGRTRCAAAWASYLRSYPEYVIHPARISAAGAQVAILGATTGSHLGLADEAELAESLIWIAEVHAGRITSWRLTADEPERRSALGLS